jgi:hypothetical protein
MEPKIIKYNYAVEKQKYVASETLPSLPCRITFSNYHNRKFTGHSKLLLKGKNFLMELARLSPFLQWVGNYDGFVIVDLHPRSYARIFHFSSLGFPTEKEAHEFAIKYLEIFFCAQKNISIKLKN